MQKKHKEIICYVLPGDVLNANTAKVCSCVAPLSKQDYYVGASKQDKAKCSSS